MNFKLIICFTISSLFIYISKGNNPNSKENERSELHSATSNGVRAMLDSVNRALDDVLHSDLYVSENIASGGHIILHEHKPRPKIEELIKYVEIQSKQWIKEITDISIDINTTLNKLHDEHMQIRDLLLAANKPESGIKCIESNKIYVIDILKRALEKVEHNPSSYIEVSNELLVELRKPIVHDLKYDDGIGNTLNQMFDFIKDTDVDGLEINEIKTLLGGCHEHADNGLKESGIKIKELIKDLELDIKRTLKEEKRV